jgi:hypothetical protein
VEVDIGNIPKARFTVQALFPSYVLPSRLPLQLKQNHSLAPPTSSLLLIIFQGQMLTIKWRGKPVFIKHR